MAEAPRILLEHHLKRLKLPTFLREYEKVAQQCAAEGLDHVQFLARLVELELIDRERRLVERRIRQAGLGRCHKGRWDGYRLLGWRTHRIRPACSALGTQELRRPDPHRREAVLVHHRPSRTAEPGSGACPRAGDIGLCEERHRSTRRRRPTRGRAEHG